jgi:hypothetical protein
VCVYVRAGALPASPPSHTPIHIHTHTHLHAVFERRHLALQPADLAKDVLLAALMLSGGLGPAGRARRAALFGVGSFSAGGLGLRCWGARGGVRGASGSVVRQGSWGNDGSTRASQISARQAFFEKRVSHFSGRNSHNLNPTRQPESANLTPKVHLDGLQVGYRKHW